MTTSTLPNPTGFSGILKTWRMRRRLSQLDLALEANLSQRHLSFLETGRSKPSRAAIAQLGEALDMPAAEIDTMLVAAGFAARSTDARWGGETRKAVMASIDHILTGHAPFPAIAVDRIWTLKNANAEAAQFFAKLGSDGDPNMVRALLKPGAPRDTIQNWSDVARGLMRLLAMETARRPNDQEAKNLFEELLNLPGVSEAVSAPADSHPEPLLTIKFEVEGQILTMFSMIATIGMSADATLDDIRIETLLPADQSSRSWFLAQKQP